MIDFGREFSASSPRNQTDRQEPSPGGRM